MEYDRFRDLTTVSTSEMPLLPERRGSSLNLSLMFVYRGTQGTEPVKEAALFFDSTTDLHLGWRFLNSRGLIVLADGERIRFEAGEHDGTVYRSSLGEIVVFRTTVDVLEKIGNARQVEIQLGIWEYSLQQGQIDTVSDIAVLMRATRQR